MVSQPGRCRAQTPGKGVRIRLSSGLIPSRLPIIPQHLTIKTDYGTDVAMQLSRDFASPEETNSAGVRTASRDTMLDWRRNIHLKGQMHHFCRNSAGAGRDLTLPDTK